MGLSLFDFFTNPLLRTPALGTVLMCLVASLMGVILLIQKRTLVGEALSHAAYPGVVISVFICALFLRIDSPFVACIILAGAALFSLLGALSIEFLEKHKFASADSALCLVLSLFFGLGVLIASHVQTTHSFWYNQIQIYLYGQVATMAQSHVFIYGCFALLAIALLILFYHQIRVTIFDPLFAATLGIPVRLVQLLIMLLVVIAVIVGIRTVGVVLMSGMLIAPALAARQYTDRFSYLFYLAAFFGALSGLMGNLFAVLLPGFVMAHFPHFVSTHFHKGFFALPTGPLIFLSGALIAIFSLLFAPKQGAFVRLYRIWKFRSHTITENILKAIWKKEIKRGLTFAQIKQLQPHSSLLLWLLLWKAELNGWIIFDGTYRLTTDGEHRAMQIVRLHRLWEVYLVDYLGQGVEKVHARAEEMEHILTKELEEELTKLLKKPTKDPHGSKISYPRGKL